MFNCWGLCLFEVVVIVVWWKVIGICSCEGCYWCRFFCCGVYGGGFRSSGSFLVDRKLFVFDNNV